MKLVAVIAASFLSVAAFAQNTAVETETASAGLIGKRYVATGFSWTDINHTSTEGLGTGLELNFPVHTNFDVGVHYSYAWFDGSGSESIGHTLGASLTGYLTRGENKPYARLSIGQFWGNEDLFGDDDDYAVWGAEVGIERAVNDKVSCTFSVGYDDDFGGHSEGVWDVAVGATYNFTSKWVGSAEIAYIEYGSVGYSVGLAYRF